MTVPNEKMDQDRLQTHLDGINFPAGKDEILEYMQDDAVDSGIMHLLERLPDRQYGNSTDVIEEIYRGG